VKRVEFHTKYAPWPYGRQIDEVRYAASGFTCVINPEEPTQPSEMLAVLDDLPGPVQTDVPKERRVLFIGEPPSVRSFSAGYLNQFGVVVCPYPLKGFRNRQIVSQTGLPWHFDVSIDESDRYLYDFSQLSDLQAPQKTVGLSVICSDKAFTPEHRERLRFVERAQDRLNGRVAWFGRGMRDVDYKAEAILPYAFHLVIENNSNPHFWTEKLADAYLGYSYPIFSGCQNIGDYFGPESLTPIDIGRPEEALDTIEAILNDPEFYRRHFDGIVKARQAVLHRYNLFAMLLELAKETRPRALVAAPEAILPSREFRSLAQAISRTVYDFGREIRESLFHLGPRRIKRSGPRARSLFQLGLDHLKRSRSRLK
jgi:hypothetical protein